MGDLKTRFTKTYLAIIGVFLAVVLVITAVLILIYVVNSPSDSFVLHNAMYHYWEMEKKELLPYALAWVVCVLLAVTATCVILMMRLYRKVAKPIGELKAATDHICGGDLNTEILGSEDREINELCRSLNTMRQRLKANQVAEEASRRDRSLLIANISHDMRTPITTIKGYLQAIRDGVADTPDQVENQN